MDNYLKIREAKWYNMWSVDWIENGFKQKEKTQACDTCEQAVELAITTQLAHPGMGIRTRDKICRNLLLRAKQEGIEGRSVAARERLARVPRVASKRKVAVADLPPQAKQRAKRQGRMRAIWRTWLRWQEQQVPDCTRARMAEVYNWPLSLVSETLNLATADAKKAYKDVTEG